MRTVALFVLTIPLAAQAPGGFRFWTKAGLEGRTETLGKKLGERRIASRQPGQFDGEAELHQKTAGIFIVQTGAGRLIVGGKSVNPVTTGPGDVRGTGVKGGLTRELRPGDAAHIPANTPRQVLVPPGGQITYVIVKVTAD